MQKLERAGITGRLGAGGVLSTLSEVWRSNTR